MRPCKPRDRASLNVIKDPDVDLVLATSFPKSAPENAFIGLLANCTANSTSSVYTCVGATYLIPSSLVPFIYLSTDFSSLL